MSHRCIAGGGVERRREEEKIGNSRDRAITGISRDTKVKPGVGTGLGLLEDQLIAVRRNGL